MSDQHIDADTAATEAARALAARRPRATFECEVCHQPFEAWVRKPDKQPARTCSPNCRLKLHRREKATRNSLPEGD